MLERRSRPWAAGAAAAIAMAAVAVLVAAVVVVTVHGDAGSALLGAADFNSISGQGTIFWGEEEGSPGRYPPEYAAQMKRMRRLVKRVKLNNDRSKALLGEEAATLREIRREMATAADEAEERLMTNVDNFKPEIAQLATKPGPAGPQGLQGFPGKRGFNGWAGLPGRPGARCASPLGSGGRARGCGSSHAIDLPVSAYHLYRPVLRSRGRASAYHPNLRFGNSCARCELLTAVVTPGGAEGDRAGLGLPVHPGPTGCRGRWDRRGMSGSRARAARLACPASTSRLALAASHRRLARASSTAIRSAVAWRWHTRGSGVPCVVTTLAPPMRV